MELSNIIWPGLSNIMKDLETYRAKNLTVSYEKPSAMKVFFVPLFFCCIWMLSADLNTKLIPNSKKAAK